jgi:aryl-alcohol dehydrogenase-like predicted oxidoreductase
MQKVICGAQGLMVSRLGLGCMGMSGAYGEAASAGPSDAVDSKALDTLYLALELGVTFWDTADIYGDGRNELLLSRVLRTERPRIQLATKCGITGRNDDGLIVNGRPDYIQQACKASLKRLGVETIDLLYLHRVDPNVPIEESAGAMGELVSQGHVRFIGLSEAGPETIQRAHKEFPLSAVQSEYSLFSRGVEAEVLPLLRELRIGLVPYSPLGRGLLTGALTMETELEDNDLRRILPRFAKENLAKNLRLVEEVKAAAKSHGCSPAQMALGWVLAQGEDIIPIPGTKRSSYLRDNAQAIHLALSSQGREALDSISKSVAGERYPKALMKAVSK